MNAPRALCQRCGLMFQSAFFSGVGTETTIIGCSESCPRCGGPASVETVIGGQPTGWDLLRDAGQAFRSADLYELQRFQAVAQAAAAGALQAAEAQRQAAEVNLTFARLIALAFQWGIPSLLVALVALWIQIKSAQSDERDHEEMMRELRGQTQQNEQLLQEWNRLQGPDAPPPPLPVESRQVRRRKAALARKQQAKSRRAARL